MASLRPAVSMLSYGVGNLGSVRNMFRRVGIQTEDLTSPDDLQGAQRVLLPGVGTFDHGMQTLIDQGWIEAIREYVQTGKPLLGICLGMQLLLDSSEEGTLPGFGFVPGAVRRFEPDASLRVPHMGWNHAVPTRPSALFSGLNSEARFYFVHTYYASTTDGENALATTEYGQSFVSAVTKDNVYGTQFHPEKSHRYGMQLLENFSRI